MGSQQRNRKELKYWYYYKFRQIRNFLINLIGLDSPNLHRIYEARSLRIFSQLRTGNQSKVYRNRLVNGRMVIWKRIREVNKDRNKSIIKILGRNRKIQIWGQLDLL